MNIKSGMTVVVSMDAPHHAGRRGIFKFFSDDGSAVISDPAKKTKNSETIFAVAPEHLLVA